MNECEICGETKVWDTDLMEMVCVECEQEISRAVWEAEEAAQAAAARDRKAAADRRRAIAAIFGPVMTAANRQPAW